MKPGNKSNSAKKVESEPFPTELKSVRKHPNTYPLLELLIRGGYSCQKMGYDPFPIRFRFDFGRTLHESPPPWVKAGCPGFARNQQKLRRKTMGGSLVAGLRPEQTLSMSESTWLKAKCWLGPAFAAKVYERGPSQINIGCQAIAFFWLSATPKAERPPGPAVCTAEGRVVGTRKLGALNQHCGRKLGGRPSAGSHMELRRKLFRG